MFLHYCTSTKHTHNNNNGVLKYVVLFSVVSYGVLVCIVVLCSGVIGVCFCLLLMLHSVVELICVGVVIVGVLKLL